MKLSKFLPSFHKTSKPQPKKEPSPRPAQTQPVVTVQPKLLDPPTNPVEMLDNVTKFLRQHLICDDHQYTLLALWIVQTWCAENFPSVPYLHIRSADSESAKTLCLRLLSALSHSPWFATGAHWRSIVDNMLTPDRRILPGKPLGSSPPQTILLDDCHHSFAASERQQVLALLNSGCHVACNYVAGLDRYSVFGPKAFTGNAPLPRSLASRCIPIVLRRKKTSDLIARFTPHAAESATRLARSVESWAAANASTLAKVAYQAPARLPAGLSARQQDCAEPLLHIAGLIGGPWPERASAALAAAWKLAEGSQAIELLSDLRATFFVREDPSYLSTHDLLAALVAREHRPWGAWSTRSGRRLGGLLHPFGITSRDLHKGSGPTFKGYLREAFLDAWERYLPPVPADWPQIRAKMKERGELPTASSS
ncbi:MAG TPA: DUF3631 domain-containing protein [Candidatus Angelobacter sp.]